MITPAAEALSLSISRSFTCDTCKLVADGSVNAAVTYDCLQPVPFANKSPALKSLTLSAAWSHGVIVWAPGRVGCL